jgi:hypothetical protein
MLEKNHCFGSYHLTVANLHVYFIFFFLHYQIFSMDKIENGFFILNFAIGAKLFCLLYAIYYITTTMN